MCKLFVQRELRIIVMRNIEAELFNNINGKKSVKKVVLYSGHDLEYRDYFVIFVQVFVLAARKFSRYVQLVH